MAGRQLVNLATHFTPVSAVTYRLAIRRRELRFLAAVFGGVLSMDLMASSSVGGFHMIDAPKKGSRRRIKFKSTVKPIPDGLARELGALVVEWGAFEFAVTLDTHLLAQNPEVQKLYKGDLPRNFRGTVKRWKDAICTLYSLSPHPQQLSLLPGVCGSDSAFLNRSPLARCR